MSVQIRIDIPGHHGHELEGDWAWPSVPRVDEFVQGGGDVFLVKTVSWEVGDRGIEFVYVVLRGVSVGSDRKDE
jgi:hypothetical protein